MENYTRISLLIISVVLFSYCNRYNYPEVYQPATEEAAKGELVFQQYCQKCHPGGEAGLGPTMLHLPGFMKRIQVRQGFGVMPDFKKDVISEEELDAIIVYLREVRRL